MSVLDIFKTKKISVPSQYEDIEAHESYRVSWYSFNFASYNPNGGLARQHPQVEIFKSKEDAERFKASLKNALKMLKTGNSIVIEKNT